MRFAHFLAFLVAAFSWSVHAAAESSPAALEASTTAASAILQGDAQRALNAVKGVPRSQFEGAQAALRDCIIQRFDTEAQEPAAPATSSDDFAEPVLWAYRRYWRAALMRPASRDDAQAVLLQDLHRILGNSGGGDFDALWPELAARLERAGWHVLGGVTAPLRELMLWRSEEHRRLSVDLPEGRREVPVALLDGFTSRGWANYASCGKFGAGGWTTESELFAVMPAYSGVDDEEFRVHFLAHEGQHFADIARFPGTPQWVLEYRAKLTELALARQIQSKILAQFESNQAESPDVPHSYANRQVVLVLRERLAVRTGASLATVPPGQLRDAAAKVLQDDTRARSGGLP